ncbi:MAG: TolC family protein [Planctomycetia bacterium]|nr:TolC family protein [Planctomycetia bacterium]
MSRLVAYATLGTFVGTSLFCATILLRTASNSIWPLAGDDGKLLDAVSPATLSAIVAQKSPPTGSNKSTKAELEPAPAKLTGTIVGTQPLRFTQLDAPAAPAPTLTVPTLPAPPHSTTIQQATLLPAGDSAPALALPVNVEENVGPTISGPTIGLPVPHAPSFAPSFTTSEALPPSAVISAPVPLPANVDFGRLDTAVPQATHPPTAQLTQPQLPPSPWSRFVASFGSGHFTEQGTISLADVRTMALRNNKDIAVLGHLPQIATATAGLEAAIFDPVLTINPLGGRYNRQVATQVQSLGNTTSNVLKTGFLLPGSSLNQVYVEKLYSTGGRVQVGIGQNQVNYSPAGSFVLVNPAWQSSINLILEQPLFRGRGPNWNEAPLRIAQANQSQSRHTFEATVNQVLRDAEFAYWDAYAAYQDHEVRRMAAAQALETVERERGRLRLGEGSVPDVAQAEEQAESFQIAQAEAENRLINAQRTLRRIMGIPPDDPRPIIPATPASDAPLVVGWEQAASQAMSRPEFGAQRAIVEAAEIEVCRRRNGLLPDISVRAIYSITGLDNHWDGAWSYVGTGGYNDWTVGAVYKQPIGRRADNSLAQRAAATLSLESARLRQLEHEVLHQLDAACRNVAAAERLLSMHRRRREAAAIQLEARRELYLENRAQLRDELDAEVRYASAVLDESIARVNYQRSLTDWNYARGAIASEDIVVAR